MKRYRPDIDGIRALAVVPVVLFHANVPGFTGGFIGVDVFFVISGYLITSILVRDIDRERFSLKRFYERRVRRLLPSSVLVLAISAVLAVVVASPKQLIELGEQMAAATTFVSNIYFWQAADYFAPTAEDNLLLHTWSLSLEEQFYVFFPLALILIGRRPRLRFALVVLTLGVSSGISELAVHLRPKFAFYMLPARAWELMAGSLLAVPGLPVPKTRKIREVLALAGVGMILASVFLLDGESSFPGVNALPAVLGTGCLLMAGNRKRERHSPRARSPSDRRCSSGACRTRSTCGTGRFCFLRTSTSTAEPPPACFRALWRWA